MTTVGGVEEKKEIGLKIGVNNGTYDNTALDSNGYLTLKVVEYDGANNPIYAEEGTWISDPIDLGDKFIDFERVFTDDVASGVSSIAIQTRVSEDGEEWSEWLAVGYDGAIQSDTEQFIQVKINMYAGFATDTYVLSDFNDDKDVSMFTPNKFIETSNGLRLKRDYQYNMIKDSSWAESGSLHRKSITKDDWLKIDKLSIQ